MASAKLVCTPLTMSIRLSELNTTQSESEKECMSRVPDVSNVGSLMYAMVCTRPNLAQVVTIMSRYMSNPRKEH